MKRTFLLISMLFAFALSAEAQMQNQQALLEAYRNGTLSQAEIEGMTGGGNAGTMAKEGDTYCLLYSRWPRSTGMTGWVIHSEVCLATSDSPFGPFKFNRVMLTKEDSDRWDRDCFHNPSLLPCNGKYYLYYMGNQSHISIDQNVSCFRISCFISFQVLSFFPR